MVRRIGSPWPLRLAAVIVALQGCFQHDLPSPPADVGPDAGVDHDTSVVDRDQVPAAPQKVTIVPNPPSGDTPELTCHYEPQVEGLTAIYRWLVNGEPPALGVDPGRTLIRDFYRVADVVTCGVRLSDGSRASPETLSPEARIRGRLKLEVEPHLSNVVASCFGHLDILEEDDGLTLWLTTIFADIGPRSTLVHRYRSSDGMTWSDKQEASRLGNEAMTLLWGPRSFVSSAGSYHAWEPVAEGLRYLDSADGLHWTERAATALAGAGLTYPSVATRSGAFHLWVLDEVGGLRHLTSDAPASWPDGAPPGEPVLVDGKPVEGMSRVRTGQSGYEMHHYLTADATIRYATSPDGAAFASAAGVFLDVQNQVGLGLDERLHDFKVIPRGDVDYVYLLIGPGEVTLCAKSLDVYLR